MEHLRFLVKDLANTVTAVLPHNRIIVGLGMLLNHMAKISQRGTRLDECQSLVEALLRDANQSLGVWCDLANTDHDAGIAMPAIFDHCDVDVDDVAVAELFIV